MKRRYRSRDAGPHLHTDADPGEHVDEGLAVELLDVSVEKIAGPRLRDAEDVDERRPIESVLAGNVRQEPEEPAADAHVFHRRAAEPRVALLHRPKLPVSAPLASSNDILHHQAAPGFGVLDR